MKSRFILLFTLAMSTSTYSMNLSWLGKFQPVVSRAASVACNYVKEHKVIAVGVGVVASAGAIAAAYKKWLFYKDVLLLRAAREGYLGAVRILLAAGANKEAVDRHGNMPFLKQINQWMPWFRKWVEEDQKIPALFTGNV